MKQPALFRCTPILALSALLLVPAEALTIQLDFSFDVPFGSAGTGFFSQSPAAKAALEAAATDVSNAITSTLGGISSSQYSIMGESGGTAAVFDWNYTIKYPGSTTEIVLDGTGIAPDTFIIYAGMHTLQGTALGEGGMGGIALQIGGSSFGDWETEWQGALDSASSQSTAIFGRDGGPTAYLIEGEADFDTTPGSYSVSTGLGVGNLWFDSDINNNGSANTLAELEAYWHFDHTTDVESGKFDFYTVAVHEILHSLGIGDSLSWNSVVVGDNWNGSYFIDLHGTGENVISGGDHIAPGIMSRRMSDGLAQVPIMNPQLAAGQRKELTELDLALMQDIGWDTSLAIPEPGIWALAGLGLAAVAFSRRRG